MTPAISVKQIIVTRRDGWQEMAILAVNLLLRLRMCEKARQSLSSRDMRLAGITTQPPFPLTAVGSRWETRTRFVFTDADDE